LNRYKEHGLEALSDRSRRPVRYANQLPWQIEQMIVRLKQEKPHWGARFVPRPPSRFIGLVVALCGHAAGAAPRAPPVSPWRSPPGFPWDPPGDAREGRA
jgi:hypothetical protein